MSQRRGDMFVAGDREQRVTPSDDLGQAGRIGGYRRRSARHGLQDRRSNPSAATER